MLGGIVAAPGSVGGESGGGLSLSSFWARWNSFRGDAYDLDGVDRFVGGGPAKLACDTTGLVHYAGTTVRYQGSVQVRPEFRERLARFERVVAETAEEVYGRKPRRVRHYGAFSCRLSRNRAHRLSEHALGNAIDIVGFDFGHASKTEPLKPDLPKQLGRAFQVRVAQHW